MMAAAHASPYLDPALYDIVYSGIGDDIPFYVELARQARGPVLEVGCGTGRVLLPTLGAAVDIDGLDLEEPMLERLRDKAHALGLTPRVYQGDMRDFTMPRRYRLITLPFRGFMHLETTEDQLRTLRCIREHLDSDGLLAFNLFYPSFDTMAANEGVRKLSIEARHPETGLAVAVYDVSRFDRVNQRVVVEREIVESDARGYAGRSSQIGFTLRWTYRYEMELLLMTVGLSRIEFFGGFDRRPLARDTDEMVVLARRD